MTACHPRYAYTLRGTHEIECIFSILTTFTCRASRTFRCIHLLPNAFCFIWRTKRKMHIAHFIIFPPPPKHIRVAVEKKKKYSLRYPIPRFCVFKYRIYLPKMHLDFAGYAFVVCRTRPSYRCFHEWMSERGWSTVLTVCVRVRIFTTRHIVLTSTT